MQLILYANPQLTADHLQYNKLVSSAINVIELDPVYEKLPKGLPNDFKTPFNRSL